MKGFDDVTLSWKGTRHTVTADRQMMLIAEIEDALCGRDGVQAIQVLMRPDGPPYSRLARAYGSALRYAGADVQDSEVYLSIMEGLGEGDGETAAAIQGAVLGLLAIIAPPIAEQINSPEKPKPADRELSEPSTG